jgi:hypothetical protein
MLIPDVLLDLTGEHLLTIEADPLCDLPELARTRTYQASLTAGMNTPWYFNIQLGGASFFSNLDHFANYVNSDAARFEIYLPGFEEEDPMVEQMSPTEFLAFEGEAIGDADHDDLSVPRSVHNVSVGVAHTNSHASIDDEGPMPAGTAHYRHVLRSRLLGDRAQPKRRRELGVWAQQAVPANGPRFARPAADRGR